MEYQTKKLLKSSELLNQRPNNLRNKEKTVKTIYSHLLNYQTILV